MHHALDTEFSGANGLEHLFTGQDLDVVAAGRPAGLW